MKTLHDRFIDKVSPEALTGCWLWTGALDNRGYARISNGKTPAGNPRSAHASHVAWDLFVGTDRNGLHLCHRCDTPACVAPHHLFLGTPKDNMVDMIAKGRAPVRWKTHCKRGHELSGGNIYQWKSGKGRSCRACASLTARKYAAAKPRTPRELAQFCGNGHEFTPENTYIPQGRTRRCKACASLISKRYDAKRRSTTKEKSK